MKRPCRFPVASTCHWRPRGHSVVAIVAIIALCCAVGALVYYGVMKTMVDEAKSGFSTQFVSELSGFDQYFRETRLTLRGCADAISVSSTTMPSAEIFERVGAAPPGSRRAFGEALLASVARRDRRGRRCFVLGITCCAGRTRQRSLLRLLCIRR